MNHIEAPGIGLMNLETCHTEFCLQVEDPSSLRRGRNDRILRPMEKAGFEKGDSRFRMDRVVISITKLMKFCSTGSMTWLNAWRQARRFCLNI